MTTVASGVEVAEMWRERYERCAAMLADAKNDLANTGRALASAEARAEEAERWRVEVAEGLGYLNRAEGLGGYEVAEPRVIIDAFRAAEARESALREAVRGLEWSFRQTALRNGGTIYTASLCPACMGEKDPPDDKGPPRRRGDALPPAGHKPDCWLARALLGGGDAQKENGRVRRTERNGPARPSNK